MTFGWNANSHVYHVVGDQVLGWRRHIGGLASSGGRAEVWIDTTSERAPAHLAPCSCAVGVPATRRVEVLAFVRDHSGCTRLDVAIELGVSPEWARQMLDDLMAQGLIERDKEEGLAYRYGPTRQLAGTRD